MLLVIVDSDAAAWHSSAANTVAAAVHRLNSFDVG